MLNIQLPNVIQQRAGSMMDHCFRLNFWEVPRSRRIFSGRNPLLPWASTISPNSWMPSYISYHFTESLWWQSVEESEIGIILKRDEMGRDINIGIWRELRNETTKGVTILIGHSFPSLPRLIVRTSLYMSLRMGSTISTVPCFLSNFSSLWNESASLEGGWTVLTSMACSPNLKKFSGYRMELTHSQQSFTGHEWVAAHWYLLSYHVLLQHSIDSTPSISKFPAHMSPPAVLRSFVDWNVDQASFLAGVRGPPLP